MKRAIPLLILIASLVLAEIAWASQDSSRMSGVKIVNCNKAKTKCLQVTSQDMLGSKLKQLHVFKSPTVELTVNGLKKTWTPTSGYIDLTEERIVFIQKQSDGSADELSYDLKTLAEHRTRIN